MRSTFREAMASGQRLVLDGAMGTALHALGQPYGACFEALCLDRPELVRSVHAAHLDAGAQILETNTFGANAIRLDRHGRARELRAIVDAAVRCAREARGGRDAFIAGAIGPTGVRTFEPDVFRAQADALAHAGVDLLIVETMRSWDELACAIDAGRRTGLPIVALGAFDATRRMEEGMQPEELARAALDRGTDVIGANCSDPAALLEVATRMKKAHPGASIAMVPSAGLPTSEGAYAITSDDFGAAARAAFAIGVQIVGGCCGTTAEHVRAIAAEATAV